MDSNSAGRNFANFVDESIHLDCFAGPFQITVILILLYQQMQWAIIPGVALLLSMIPINLVLQRIQKTLTVRMYHWNSVDSLNFHSISPNKWQ